MASVRGSRRIGPTVGLPLLVAAAVVAADQLVKALIVWWLGSDRADQRFELLGAVLAVEYVENTGAAFGTFRGRGALLGLLALLVLGGLIAYYRRLHDPSRWTAIGVGLIVGGAIGNLLDRIRLEHVVDFVAVGVWPKFNLADSAITVGVALLAWQALTSRQPSAVSRQLLGVGEAPANDRSELPERHKLMADG